MLKTSTCQCSNQENRMRKCQAAALVVVALFTTACATPHGVGATYVPLVDLKDKPQEQFDQDLKQCQGLAAQRAQAAEMAAAGAVAAALLGAILAPRGYRNEVAGRSALLGGAAGAGQAMETQADIVKRCLAGRGYTVLN